MKSYLDWKNPYIFSNTYFYYYFNSNSFKNNSSFSIQQSEKYMENWKFDRYVLAIII